MNFDELLESINCNEINQVKARFLGDVSFYIQVACEALNQSSILYLGEALHNHQNQRAFEEAHNLKGIFMNCGFTSLYPFIFELVELLRKESFDYPLMNKYFEDLIIEIKKIDLKLKKISE